jgi:hypothetical protein
MFQLTYHRNKPKKNFGFKNTILRKIILSLYLSFPIFQQITLHPVWALKNYTKTIFIQH